LDEGIGDGPPHPAPGPEPQQDQSSTGVAAQPFPFGRPPPDWVFQQKYAGVSESEFALAREEVAAAYALASKRAFQKHWDLGEYELVPLGQPQAIPNDDRIIGGRVLPGTSESQVVRLSVEEHPEVYELFYEHLWLATTDWKP
jgi:hypothetical protein